MTHRRVATTPNPPLEGPWLQLSAALTECAAQLSEREDMVVRCAPGAAGPGEVGSCTPALGTIALDGNLLHVDPATCTPTVPQDRERYRELWGVFVHEAAHGRHTRWTPSPGTPGAVFEAAMTLEESRIEARHLGRRPEDRRWLREATRSLILGPGIKAAMTPWDAAWTAAVVLARADAGVLTEAEASPVRHTVEKTLGKGRLRRLRSIWRTAQTTADGDGEAMLGLGRAWCETLGVDPDDGSPGSPGQRSASSEEVSPLAKAIIQAVRSLDTAASPPPSTPAAERDHREQAAATARRVFQVTEVHTRPGTPPARKLRPPTPAEQSAARRIARALRAAAYRERAAATVTSPTPPGRLRMREVIAADAQRTAGAIPTAAPFTRTVHRRVPSPPLRLGIACDVSGSMETLAKPVASAAWILARAASYVTDAHSATVTFGNAVHPVTYPGTVPTQVREFAARDATEEFCGALDALDGVLELSRPRAARLLIIVSDGRFRPRQRASGQQRLTRLVRTGCAVLWLALGDGTQPLHGVGIVTLARPSEAADVISRAAILALRLT